MKRYAPPGGQSHHGGGRNRSNYHDKTATIGVGARKIVRLNQESKTENISKDVFFNVLIFSQQHNMTDSWATILQLLRLYPIDNYIRYIYEKLILLYPLSIRLWQAYIDHEISNPINTTNNTHNDKSTRIDKLFQRCLPHILHVDMYIYYLKYVHMTASSINDSELDIDQAYDFALKRIGNDINSKVIWEMKIQFIKTIKSTSIDDTIGQKQAIKQAYITALSLPIISGLLPQFESWLSDAKIPNHEISAIIPSIDKISRQYNNTVHKRQSLLINTNKKISLPYNTSYLYTISSHDKYSRTYIGTTTSNNNSMIPNLQYNPASTSFPIPLYILSSQCIPLSDIKSQNISIDPWSLWSPIIQYEKTNPDRLSFNIVHDRVIYLYNKAKIYCLHSISYWRDYIGYVESYRLEQSLSLYIPQHNVTTALSNDNNNNIISSSTASLSSPILPPPPPNSFAAFHPVLSLWCEALSYAGYSLILRYALVEYCELVLDHLPHPPKLIHPMLSLFQQESTQEGSGYITPTTTLLSERVLLDIYHEALYTQHINCIQYVFLSTDPSAIHKNTENNNNNNNDSDIPALQSMNNNIDIKQDIDISSLSNAHQINIINSTNHLSIYDSIVTTVSSSPSLILAPHEFPQIDLSSPSQQSSSSSSNSVLSFITHDIFSSYISHIDQWKINVNTLNEYPRIFLAEYYKRRHGVLKSLQVFGIMRKLSPHIQYTCGVDIYMYMASFPSDFKLTLYQAAHNLISLQRSQIKNGSNSSTSNTLTLVNDDDDDEKNKADDTSSRHKYIHNNNNMIKDGSDNSKDNDEYKQIQLLTKEIKLIECEILSNEILMNEDTTTHNDDDDDDDDNNHTNTSSTHGNNDDDNDDDGHINNYRSSISLIEDLLSRQYILDNHPLYTRLIYKLLILLYKSGHLSLSKLLYKQYQRNNHLNVDIYIPPLRPLESNDTAHRFNMNTSNDADDAYQTKAKIQDRIRQSTLYTVIQTGLDSNNDGTSYTTDAGIITSRILPQNILPWCRLHIDSTLEHMLLIFPQYINIIDIFTLSSIPNLSLIMNIINVSPFNFTFTSSIIDQYTLNLLSSSTTKIPSLLSSSSSSQYDNSKNMNQSDNITINIDQLDITDTNEHNITRAPILRQHYGKTNFHILKTFFGKHNKNMLTLYNPLNHGTISFPTLIPDDTIHSNTFERIPDYNTDCNFNISRLQGIEYDPNKPYQHITGITSFFKEYCLSQSFRYLLRMTKTLVYGRAPSLQPKYNCSETIQLILESTGLLVSNGFHLDKALPPQALPPSASSSSSSSQQQPHNPLVQVVSSWNSTDIANFIIVSVIGKPIPHPQHPPHGLLRAGGPPPQMGGNQARPPLQHHSGGGPGGPVGPGGGPGMPNRPIPPNQALGPPMNNRPPVPGAGPGPGHHGPLPHDPQLRR